MPAERNKTAHEELEDGNGEEEKKRRAKDEGVRTKLKRYSRSLTCRRYARLARSSAGSICFRMSISTSRWNCRCKHPYKTKPANPTTRPKRRHATTMETTNKQASR